MATSGTYTNRTNRNEIINGALRLLSAVDPENTAGATSTQITNGAEALNLMVKAFANKGLHIWERKYGVIFPQYSQGVYVLGSPGPAGDHASLTSPLGAGFVATTLSSAAASGATTISVTSVTSRVNTAGSTGTTITDTYAIGVELDDKTVQWTTVSGAPSGTTVTLATALTGAAASGNAVYVYQTKLIRPLRINQAFIHDLDGDEGREIRVIPKDEYNNLSNKTAVGATVSVSYDPRINTGHLYVYPEFDRTDKLLYIEFQSPIEDFTSSTHDYDMPQEFGELLKFQLAVRMAPEYEVPSSKFKQLVYLADMAWDAADGYDQEYPSSVTFQPAPQWP